MGTRVTRRLRAFLHDDEGQDLLEYALLAGLIAMAAYVAVQSTGTSVTDFYEVIDSTMDGVPR
jgi:pilus assembly protein Flp/PilA